MAFDPEVMYLKLTRGANLYKEKIHCPMILRIMADNQKGTLSAFCVEAGIGEDLFYKWLGKHEELFACYMYGKMIARYNWEQDGLRIRSLELPIGTQSHEFEYWRLVGWSRFGVAKNSRIRLSLDPTANPSEHYKQLLAQAAQGDFTAGEIKQLMEAVNVGLNAHQVFELQNQIDELKSDLTKMSENRNVQNTIADKGTP